MKIFAEVLNGTIRYIGETEVVPQFAPSLISVDITDMDPQPSVGDVLQGDGTFMAPPEPEPPAPIRILTKYEFLCRFTPEERKAIRATAKTDADVEDFQDLLNVAQEINLDDPNMSLGFALLVSKGLLTQERASAILA